MTLNGFLKIFNPRAKLALHIVEVFIIVVVIILCVVRMATKNSSTPRSQIDRMGLAMGAKSLIVVFYQVLSEHVRKFHRWASARANLILNCLEIIFWAAVAFMAIQANAQSCNGLSCQLGWAILVVAIVLSKISFYVAGISYVVFRDSRGLKNPSTSSEIALENDP